MLSVNHTRRFATAAAVCVSLLALASTAAADPVIFSASGANPAGIQATVDAFRTQLGALNPNVAGSFGSGRREINWDGVPNGSSAPNNLPANFFNVNSPRGVVFSTPGTGFQVSANAGIAPIEFDNINPSYSAQFQTFSPQRLFTAVGSNILDVTFFIPGSNTQATVSGFGSVFTDVDLSSPRAFNFSIRTTSRSAPSSPRRVITGCRSLASFSTPASASRESGSSMAMLP